MKRPPTEKTKQQVRREALEKAAEEELRKKLEAAGIAASNNPAMPRTHVPAPIMRGIDDAPAGSRERRFRLFALLDKVREMRGGAPGDFDPAMPEPESAPCMVKYRSVSPTERRRLFFDERPGPGPDYYYCKDDLTYEKKPNWTFAKEERIRKPRWDDIDRREGLDPKYDLVLARAPGAVINPEHAEVPRLDELENMRLGPGAYEQSYKLVEPRVDAGVPRFPKLTENNAREAQMDPNRGREIFDNDDLDVNMRAVLPNVPGPVMAPPTVVETAHPPDAALVPERWEFYDWNVNAVREDQSKKAALIGGGKARDEFAEHENFMKMMREYFDRQRTMPEVGQYDPSLKLQEKRINVPDFKKYLLKDLIEPIEKPEGPVDGDNLILNPTKPQPYFQNLQFKKYSARRDEIEEQKLEVREELQIEPNLDIVRPKRNKGYVDMKKMQQRPDYKIEQREMQEQAPKLDIKVDYKQVEPKVLGHVSLAPKRPGSGTKKK